MKSIYIVIITAILFVISMFCFLFWINDMSQDFIGGFFCGGFSLALGGFFAGNVYAGDIIIKMRRVGYKFHGEKCD